MKAQTKYASGRSGEPRMGSSRRARTIFFLASALAVAVLPASAEDANVKASPAIQTTSKASEVLQAPAAKTSGEILIAANKKRPPAGAAKPHAAKVHKNAPSQYKHHFFGKADFYASSLHGHPTASGTPYDENKLTAAHRKLPFGTKVTVVNRTNGKTCTLTINDRGPFTANRVIDVSKAAAKQLGLMNDKNRMVDCFIRIESSDFLKPRQVAGKETAGAI